MDLPYLHTFADRDEAAQSSKKISAGNVSRNAIITMNIPVVFMARYVMVLRGATSLRGALEGVGPENRDFFGP
jgi:hypothetical protein